MGMYRYCLKEYLFFDDIQFIDKKAFKGGVIREGISVDNS